MKAAEGEEPIESLEAFWFRVSKKEEETTLAGDESAEVNDKDEVNSNPLEVRDGLEGGSGVAMVRSRFVTGDVGLASICDSVAGDVVCSLFDESGGQAGVNLIMAAPLLGGE